MDLSKAIQELYAEKEKVEQAIALLEELQKKGIEGAARSKPPKRRGRKTMDPAEREEVSRRMRAYWDSRRNQNTPGSQNLKTPARH